MISKKRIEHRSRIKRHIRLSMSGTAERPRFTVFRSLKHVYAQIVDDSSGKTLVAVSDLSKGLRESFAGAKGQVAIAKLVGQQAAKQALEKKITAVIFDRNGFRYHGAVKAMADGAREAGLKF